MSKPRGRWKCIWNCVALSRRLGRCSFLAEIIYIRGIAVSDAHGMLRRGDVKAAILPTRKGISLTAINAAVDELLALDLLCQPGDGGEPHLHWCFHDDYQQPRQRTGRRGAPLCTFTCPNEKRQIQSPDKSGVVRTTPAKQQTADNRQQTTDSSGPPYPPNRGAAAADRFHQRSNRPMAARRRGLLRAIPAPRGRVRRRLYVGRLDHCPG